MRVTSNREQPENGLSVDRNASRDPTTLHHFHSIFIKFIRRNTHAAIQFLSVNVNDGCG